MNSTAIAARHEPLLITVAPNGARRTKIDHAALPILPEEIATTAARCLEAGAALLHLHVRDAQGRHSLDSDRYRSALREIDRRVGPGLLVQVTTEACGIYAVDAQIRCVQELEPQAASFAIREFFPGEQVDPRVADFFGREIPRGLACQFILYAPEEIDRLRDLVAQGLIPLPRPHALFVLGRHVDGVASDPASLDAFLARWPRDWPWSVCAFGPPELAVMARAIQLGGHVRVGFENNLDDAEGRPLASNEARVREVAALAAAAGRPLLDAAGARALFTLPAKES